MVSSRSVNVHSGKEVAEGVTLMGATPNIGIILDFEPVEGRFLTEIEDSRRMNVAFIGNDIKTKFFPGRQSHRADAVARRSAVRSGGRRQGERLGVRQFAG